MKIGIGNRRVPSNDDVVPNAQLQFTKQYSVGETTIIADFSARILTERKVRAIQGAMPAHNERLFFLAMKAFEGELPANDRVNSKEHVAGQFTVEPTARFEDGRGRSHDAATTGSRSSN